MYLNRKRKTMTFCLKQRIVSAASACVSPLEPLFASDSGPNRSSGFVTGTEATESNHSHGWYRNSNCYCAWIARNTWMMVFLLRSLLRQRRQTRTPWASSFESFPWWQVEIEEDARVCWVRFWSLPGQSCH